MTDQRVELLSPAGSMESFLGALNAGADAVYLGGPDYGARAYADNFTPEEIIQVIRIAHLHHVRIYLTVNILTRQQELDACIRMVQILYEHGLDGAIVQDLGVLNLLRKTCPGLLLHASTQLSCTLPESARFFKRLGVSRIVPARELSLGEIKAIRKENVEVECFIHGAMCYCYSGRCLLSSFLGGRSGNRGRCAGSCRQPYLILDENRRSTFPADSGLAYPISMRDMCTLQILPSLIDAGISSFKIEGRMKKPAYAAGVTAVYRKYMDRFYLWDQNGRPGIWQVDDEDYQKLTSLYLRKALSAGYYEERNGRDMVTLTRPGYNGTDPALLRQIQEQYVLPKPCLPIAGKVVLRTGRTVSLTVDMMPQTSSADTAVPAPVCVSSTQVVTTARNHPLSTEEIRRSMMKTGNTDFYFKQLSIEKDENIFFPVSSLNALRREALEELATKAAAIPGPDPAEESVTPFAVYTACSAGSANATGDAGDSADNSIPGSCGQRQKIFIMVQNREQLISAARYATDLIIDGRLLDQLTQSEGLDRFPGSIWLAFPYIFRQSDIHSADKLYEIYDRKHNSSSQTPNLWKKLAGFLCRTIEEIEFLREKDYDGRVIVDSSVYRWNTEADKLLAKYYDYAVMPLELDGRELFHTFCSSMDRQVMQVYGRLPMMVTANCVRKTTGNCDHKENRFWYLKDRKGILFPVRTDCQHCQNIIYNSVPLSLHKFADDAAIQESGALLFSFTVESRRVTDEILKYYADIGFFGTDPVHKNGESASSFPCAYTTGHYRRGAI